MKLANFGAYAIPILVAFAPFSSLAEQAWPSRTDPNPTDWAPGTIDSRFLLFFSDHQGRQLFQRDAGEMDIKEPRQSGAVEPRSDERAKAIKADVPLPDDVQTRINSLNSELRKDRDREYWFARLNYYWALVLMAITLIASFTAGIGGLFFGLDGRVTGGIAVLPGLIALAATAIDWQGRANWHYRKTDALDALINQLRYELHVPPSPEDVAAISKARTDLNSKMSAEWEQRLGLDWSVFKQNAKH